MSSVNPAGLLRELSDLWVSFGKQGDSEAGTGVLRACSMTLVILAEESEDAVSLGETIAALMPEHPARTIVVRLHGGQERSLSARVFAQCWMPFGKQQQICCEQVEITASDAALPDLPSVVVPLAAPDLPVILWCRSPRLLEMPEFPSVAAAAGKLVVDSLAAPSARAAVARLAAWAANGQLLGDLAWTRLTRWREMMAQVFENRQYLAQLPQVSSVTVAYGGDTPAAAWYMGAWLLLALESVGVRAQFHRTREAEGRQGRLNWVELAGEDFRLRLQRNEETIVTTVDGLSHCSSLPQHADYELMREELAIVRHDPVFEHTLASAERLAVSSSNR
ncbi:MAG TPA: glucose-6-phosphate dehydrogenase assembly protein OpcA [Bryobacteraceae bacterium]|nr:glucose-6-phosphate dehydrogenase assembly protein OpcA [Bryobacteraceae bacterium]